MAAKEETALDAARSRFVEGLPKKAAELRAALALLVAAPGSERGRDEMRRRLHALHASAQVFRVDELSRTVADAIALLDRMKREARAIGDDELDRLMATTAAVAELGGADSAAVDALLDEVRRPTLPGAGPSPVGGDARPGMQTVQSLERDDDLVPTRPGTVASVPPSRSIVAPKPSATQVGNASEVTPRPRSNPPVSTVVSVMLVGPVAARLAVLLPADRFEIVAAEGHDALTAARAGAPDVIVVGDDIVKGIGSEFVRTIRSDAATDLVPLLLVSAQANLDRAAALGAGCDDVIATGIESRPLAQKIARLAGLLPSSREAELGTRTLREIADRMAEELRRGLVDSVDRGLDERLSLGDGTELFAAVWSAIARMRTTVVDRSGGRVRFRDAERRGGPAFLSLGETAPDASAARSSTSDVSIVGRRILVADDDPAVRWFFVGLLQDAGADVIEAPDGAAALELARQNTPDLVITDILMPKLDGLSLTRELHRDPVLAEVPIIFLSWKEDYLQRMRELRAGAAGYLRKEEGAATILDRVRDAFRPRLRFETRLRDGGDVRGRVEGIGVLSILRSVGRIRRDARVTVRDVHNLFEIDVRRGQIVELVRTGGDGSFARGGKALASLLGVSAGRFAVLAPAIGQKPGIEPIGPETIEREARRLGALVDAVSGRGLALADRVDLDPLVVAPILAVSPPEIVDVVRKLEANPSPRRWLLSGEVAPEVLGGALIELARRGAVLAVRGEHGEDRVSESLALRLGVDASELDGGRTGALISIPPEDAPEDAVEALDDERSEVAEALESISDAEVSESTESLEGEAVTDVTDAEVSELTDAAGSLSTESGEFSADESLATTLDMDDDDAPVAPTPTAARPDVGANKPSVVIHGSPHAKARRREGGYDDTLKVRVDPRLPQEPEPDAPSRSTLVLGGLGLCLVLGLGYVVYSATRSPAHGPAPAAHRATQAAGRPAPSPTPAPAPAANVPTPPSLDPPIENAMLYGERVDAATVGVPVPAGQGGLVVNGPVGLTVHVDGRDLGAAPQALAVSEGWHTLELRAGDDERVLFIPIRAGQARRITMP